MDGLCVFSSFLALIILSCQAFGLQKIHEACNSPLGIKNGQIPDTHLSASSYSSYLYIGGGKHMDMQAKYCRLNNKYAWCTNKGKKEQSWLMVDLGQITNVTAISTQGFAGVSDYFVSSFKLAYSIYRNLWKFVGENGVDKVFEGNKHGLDIKNNNFSQIEARYIKIFPVSFSIRICLRIELFGCVQGSSIPATTTSTTPFISTPKITSSTLSSTSTTITQKSSAITTPVITKATSIKPTAKTSVNQLITPSTLSSTSTTITQKPFAITTSVITKATSIKPTAKTSVNPTNSSKSPSIATSLYTTGIPSNQHSTRILSSQSVPATSARSSITHPVAMTTIQPSKGVSTTIATLINALHRKRFSDDEKKKDFIITGFSIFGGLALLVILPVSIFCIVKRRKRSFNMDCPLVDLPEYPYNKQVNSNESFIALENDSAVIHV